MTAKARYQLNTSGTASDAARSIFLTLLAAVRYHENGILKGARDDDVHDYRVSIRRIRSALKLFKPLLNDDRRKQFNEGFRTIARSTNHLRDLEVFLENKPAYLKDLPRAERENIAPLFYYLEQEQVEEFKQLVIMLGQPGYQSFLNEWELYNQMAEAAYCRDEAACTVKLIPFAEEAVRALFERVRELRDEVEQSGDYELMHQLRIECKRLRYALEFFHDLNKERFPVVIKVLKRVQDHLGDLNDLVNHERITKEVLEDWKGMDAKTDESCSACRMLLKQLREKQDRLTEQFPAVFQSFTEEMNKLTDDDLVAHPAASD